MDDQIPVQLVINKDVEDFVFQFNIKLYPDKSNPRVLRTPRERLCDCIGHAVQIQIYTLLLIQ